MIVTCPNLAQIDNISRSNDIIIYIATYNNNLFFGNFKDRFSCNHDFLGIYSTYKYLIKNPLEDTFIAVYKVRKIIFDSKSR